MSFKSGTRSAINFFEQLKEDIVNEKINAMNSDSESIIIAIKNYVNEICLKDKSIAKKIKEAEELKRIRVYDYLPGTGKATIQFYKFAKAIEREKVTSKNINVESLLLLI